MKKIFTVSFFLLIVLHNGMYGQDAIQIAKSYLFDHKDHFNLSNKDLGQMTLKNFYKSAHSGVSHLYFKQQHNGLEVESSILGIHVDRNGEVAYTTSSFVRNIEEKVTALSPQVLPNQALVNVLHTLDIPVRGKLKKLNSSNDQSIFAGDYFADNEVPVKLCYYPDRLTGKVHLAWKVDLDETGKPDYWYLYVDAIDGGIIAKNNYTIHCHFSTPISRDQIHDECADLNTLANVEHPQQVLNTDGDVYNVFPLNIESPIHGERALLADPADLNASPFGWLDTNGIPGFDLTITRGNNAHAFLDLSDEDFSQGDEPDAGNDLLFDFPFDPLAEPEANRDASVTQLFYANNAMHDFTYAYGFDEQAGNFQFNNYNKGGIDGDYILAQAQDGGDLNNANFATLPDGFRGRMQMYIWGVSGIGFLEVVEPVELAERIPSRQGSFGPQLTEQPIEGDLVLALDGTSNGNLLCESAINGDELEGKVALIQRGGCFFETKVKNAEEAGAIAVIVCNVEESIISMGSTDEVEDPGIPSIMINRSSCDRIKLALGAGVKVRLQVPMVEGPTELDASFDNGIIAHEYGHGISNRLTGGPSEVSCLSNDEQMGEGWSDFFTLVTSVNHDTDTPDKSRGIGNYVIRTATNGQGIRRQRYAADFTINNQTYDDIITSSSAPHPVGEIWAATLWDLYWAMVDKHGFDSDQVRGNGGNNRAIQLVMDGMKLQQCNPGFVDGRDGILAADRILYGGENECLIWEVFAKRGIGWGASQGNSFDRRDGTPSFETQPACLNQLVVAKKVTELINPGDTMQAEIKIFNYGSEVAGNIVVTEEIPNGASYILNSETTSLNSAIEVFEGTDFIEFRLDQALFPGDSVQINFELVSSPELGSIQWFFDGGESQFEFLMPDSLDGDGQWKIDSIEAFSANQHWFIATTDQDSDQALQTISPVLIDGVQPVLRFYHQYVTEPNFDGGIVQISRDGVIWEVIDDDRFFKNPYRGEIAYSAFIIPNANGFWGNGQNYRDTYVDLSDYQGEEVYIRFRFANLSNFLPDEGIGWLIDDIEIMDMFNYSSETCVSVNQEEAICVEAPNRGTIVNPIESIVTNTEDVLLENAVLSIDVFPNPVRTRRFAVDIRTPDKGTIQLALYNAEGKLVETKVLEDRNKGLIQTFMDVQTLVAGMYTLRVTTTENSITSKVLIY